MLAFEWLRKQYSHVARVSNIMALEAGLLAAAPA